MMKVLFKTEVKYIVLLIAVCQLFIISCSKKLSPETSFINIENHADQKKLNDFMTAGTEKELDTHSIHPDEIIETAEKYLGVPHCMGGTTMKCMDCSGLLVKVFAEHGVLLPHNSQEQARYGKMVTVMNELKKGDLVFFIRSYDTHNFITHSGIYIGGNRFIHTSSGKGVTITSLNDPWWKERFIFGTRVLE
jgi:murein DD-endopeptidase / murein LD-carboxypeptidase